MPRQKPRKGDLPAALTAHRMARGYTLEALANALNDRAGVTSHTKGTVGRWERGERGVSPANQRLLAAVYGITVGELQFPPRDKSIDKMLDGQPAEVWEEAEAIVSILLRRAKARESE